MQIVVTAENIAQGWRRKESRCPIALAIKRDLGSVDVLVHECDARISCAQTKYYWQTFDLPQECVDFIALFDAGKPVAPFTFDLEFPTEVNVFASRFDIRPEGK